MATYYWDASGGNDSNDGLSASAPFKTFGGVAPAAALAGLSSGDLVYLSGTFRPVNTADLNTFTLFALSSRTGVTIRQWPGMPQAVIRADAVVAGSFVDSGAGYWTTTIEASLNNSGNTPVATVGYDANTWTGTNGDTLYRGIMRSVAAGSVAATNYSFNYNNTTGELRVRMDGSLNPNSFVVTLVRGGSYKNFDLSGCTNCYVYDLVGHLAGLLSTSSGYVFSLTNCTNCHYVNCKAHNGGFHPFGAIGSGGSTTNDYNFFIRCTGAGGGTNSTIFVHYCDEDVQYSGYRDCVAHVHYHLDYEGASCYSSPTGCTGFHMHTAAAIVNNGGTNERSGNEIVDIEITRCRAYCYQSGVYGCKGFSYTDLPEFTGTTYQTTGRAARFVECQSWDDSNLTCNNPALFQRCILRLTEAGTSGVITTGAIKCNEQTAGGTGTFLTCLPLFDSCVIIVNSDNASAGNIFEPRTTAYTAGSGPALMNCTIIDVGTGSNQLHVFDYNANKANFSYHVSGCAISHTKTGTARLCGDDTTLLAAVHDFDTNAYCAFTVFSQNTSYDTQGEWSSAIDTGTAKTAPLYTTTTAMGFLSPSTTGEVTMTSSLNAFVQPVAATANGVSGHSFSGCYGAWQFPAGRTAGSRRNRARV